MGDNYQIQRDDGVKDGIAGQVFASYDEAYAVVERYYADIWASPGFVDSPQATIVDIIRALRARAS